MTNLIDPLNGRSFYEFDGKVPKHFITSLKELDTDFYQQLSDTPHLIQFENMSSYVDFEFSEDHELLNNSEFPCSFVVSSVFLEQEFDDGTSYNMEVGLYLPSCKVPQSFTFESKRFLLGKFQTENYFLLDTQIPIENTQGCSMMKKGIENILQEIIAMNESQSQTKH